MKVHNKVEYLNTIAAQTPILNIPYILSFLETDQMTIQLLLALTQQKNKPKKSDGQISLQEDGNVDQKIEQLLLAINGKKNFSITLLLNELEQYIFSLFNSEVVFSKKVIKALFRVVH